MFDLVLYVQYGLVFLVDIFECQGIFFFYLEQLFVKLCCSSLVFSVCGLGGGYQLLWGMEIIQVVQVIDVVNELVDVIWCQGFGDCYVGDICLIYYLWCDFSQQIYEFFSGISLVDFVMCCEVQEVVQCQDLCCVVG